MRKLIFAAAFLLGASPAYAVDVPDRAEFDALDVRVQALESVQPAAQADLDTLRQESEAADSALQQAIDALRAIVESYHPVVVDNPPTVANLAADCGEDVPCSGDIGAADDNGPITVTWGSSPLLAFTGNPNGAWSATPVDGDGLASYTISGTVSDGVNPAVPFDLVITVADSVTQTDPDPLPQSTAGNNLQDCVDHLTAQGGGWCEIGNSTNNISAVYPTNLPGGIRLNGGPSAMLHAWSGAAYDGGTTMWFIGGGHADYGGNEVYEFDMATGTWTRLTDPSMTHLFVLAQASATHGRTLCWAPDLRTLPPSSHTYDGLEYMPETGTVMFVSYGHATGTTAASDAARGNTNCFYDDAGDFDGDPRVIYDTGPTARGQGIFEFNPSRTETRNGLAPLTWRRQLTRDATTPDIGYPSVYQRTNSYKADDDGDGLPERCTVPSSGIPPAGCEWEDRYYVGTKGYMCAYYPPTEAPYLGRFATDDCVSWSDRGEGYRINRGRDLLSLFRNLYNNTLVIYGDHNGNYTPPAPHGKAMDFNADGLLFLWDGKDKILTYDLDTNEWQVFDWSDGGPQVGHTGAVYGKWRYVASHDVFVGISTDQTGVWVYQHPEGMPPVQLGQGDPQALINAASAGDTVTIPPGVYQKGVQIDKSLTLNMAGVRLWGVYGSKAVVNVECDGCTVVINDLWAEGKNSGCRGGNCAGIKATGIDFHLIVNRAHIDRTVMGILTDNRGGTLEINDSLIENIGVEDGSGSLSHSVYGGNGVNVTMRDSTVRCNGGTGHLFKARGEFVLIENSRLLGKDVDNECPGVNPNGPIKTWDTTDDPDAGYLWRAGERHSRVADFACGGNIVIRNTEMVHSDFSDNPDLFSYLTEPSPTHCPNLYHGSITFDGGSITTYRDRSYDEPGKNNGQTTLFKWYDPQVDPAVGIVFTRDQNNALTTQFAGDINGLTFRYPNDPAQPQVWPALPLPN